METHKLSRTRALVHLLIIACALAGSPAGAATVPPGFSDTLVSGGLSAPTAMQFAPDGRLFVCEQGGTLRVIKNGALLPTPFVSLTVSSIGERGLLGIAFDPAFAANQFVYLYYTATTPSIHNRISRFTASGDVVVPGSELPLFDLPDLVFTNHNGGALAFGPDGKLYAAVGENANPSNAQSLNTTLGKMLRLNTDGTIPTDNPFFATTTGVNRAIWAYGLRNPFTFAFDLGGTRMFINDVGQNTWEEIDNGIAGANYGWPNSEGYTSDAGITSPLYAYDHGSGGCAITGGAFYSPFTDLFPSVYSGSYFFADYCAGWIQALAGNTVLPFASGISLPVDIKVTDDGDLYYLERGTGSVRRIAWVATVTADSVAPASGSGSSQTFALHYSDTAGVTNISTAWVWFNASFATSAASSCISYYDRASNTVSLLNDAGTAWMSSAVGDSGALQNSRCSIALGGSTTVNLNGNTLTVNLAMTFAPIFAGAKNTYMYAANASGSGSGWQTRGTWAVPGGPDPAVSIIAVGPASGSGSRQQFSLVFEDAAGATNISTTWVWFNATFASSAANSCFAYYDRPANRVFLLNDAGSAYMSGVLGSSVVLQNSQCGIDLESSYKDIPGEAPGGVLLDLHLMLRFTPAFAGAKNTYVYAANASGANTGWQTRGTWTVVAAPVVTADSVTPASGAGSNQTFALQFSDTAGAADLASLSVRFGATAGPLEKACIVFYYVATNTLVLVNDAADGSTSATVGSDGVLQNSRCLITTGGSTTVTSSGTTLTLNLAMTFAPTFAVSKSIYLLAHSLGGFTSGWQARGVWDGSGPVPVVTADSVTPASGAGANQIFATQFSDAAGATDLTTVLIWFNATRANFWSSCLARYDRPSNTVFLANDAATMYMSGVVGAPVVLQNSQCAIDLGSTTATAIGTTLSLSLAMTFTPAFNGVKNVDVSAANASGGGTIGWQTLGVWTVPGSPVPAVTADSVTPASGSGASQSFALRFSDTAGATDLSTAWVWFNATSASTAANSCLVYYDRMSNTLSLLNDGGDAWIAPAVRTAGTLQNSQCAIALGGTTVIVAGPAMTLNLALTFSPMFAGAKNVYLYAANGSGVNSGWQMRGTWTATAGATPAVTADSVTPAAGTGASQAFALQVSDTSGGTNISTAWVWFNATFASSAANSCLAYYDRPSNTVFLLNDAGTMYVSGVVGAAGALMNSQCTITLGGSTTTVLSGNTLTLNLAMTFAPMFAGAKNVYLYGSGAGGANSGWQTRGAWTVP